MKNAVPDVDLYSIPGGEGLKRSLEKRKIAKSADEGDEDEE